MNQDDACPAPGSVSLEAQGYFQKEGLYCSEAVLLAVDRAFGCGLGREVAVALGSALPQGLSSGCLCGAVSGAAAALGLVLGGKLPRERIRCLSKELHDEFKSRYKSTCCRVLTKRAGSEKAHYAQCNEFTTQTAHIAVGLILKACPELAPELKQSNFKTRLAALLRGLAAKLEA